MNHIHSLFIGRWQPFHSGHKTLIETVLKKNKPVVIAIRDTAIDHKNPYTTSERWSMIHDELEEYGSLVKIIVIPDIDEVCYGRDVGYAVRNIELDAITQNISGTKERERRKPTYPIVWLTGQSGAGKSTLAELLKAKLGATVLDGDEMRESISLNAGFSKKEREEHNLRVARLAKTLSKQSPVIVSVIAPFNDTREKIDVIAKPFWVHVDRNLPTSKERPYEKPTSPHITVHSDKKTPGENCSAILQEYNLWLNI